MSQSYWDRMKRKNAERKTMDAIADQPLILDDGSGQQVGVLDQQSGKEMNTSMNQKLEEGRAKLLEKQAVKKKLAKSKEVKAPSKITGAVDNIKGIQSITGAGQGGSSDGTDSTGDAMNAGMTAFAATGNPYAAAGAAAISLISSGQKRKEARRQAKAAAKEDIAEGKRGVSKIYSDLSASMSGLLR
jgi:hypothetical protein